MHVNKVTTSLFLQACPMDTRCIHFSSTALISSVHILDSFQPCLREDYRAASHTRKGFLLLQITSHGKTLCSAKNLSETFRNLELLPFPEGAVETASLQHSLQLLEEQSS